MNKRLSIALVGLVLSYGSLAQTIPNPPPAGASQIAKFFPAAAVTTGGSQNLNALVTGYITPIAEDFGALSSNGWFNTGNPHKKFGFDLSVSLNAASANSSDKYFSVPTLQGVTYNGTLPTSSGGGKAPTAYGPEGEYPAFNFNASGGPNGTPVPIPFYGPDGGNISKDIPIGNVAVPTINGGVGLLWNTDLRFKFTPTITISKTQLSGWGVGFMHDIKQHFKGLKMAPISLSLLLAYSQLTATTDASGIYYNSSAKTSYSGQQGVGDTKSYTAQIVFSKSIPVVTFYAAVGYTSSTTNYAIKGSYYVDAAYTVFSLPGVPLLAPVTLNNPYSKDFTTGGMRLTGGLRFKFGPVFLNGDYSYYNSAGLFNMGLGFTVR